jgi:hypothetical protein
MKYSVEIQPATNHPIKFLDEEIKQVIIYNPRFDKSIEIRISLDSVKRLHITVK